MNKKLYIRNNKGDRYLIPDEHADWIRTKINEGCHNCVNSYIGNLSNSYNTFETPNYNESPKNLYRYKHVNDALDSIQQAATGLNVFSNDPTNDPVTENIKTASNLLKNQNTSDMNYYTSDIFKNRFNAILRDMGINDKKINKQYSNLQSEFNDYYNLSKDSIIKADASVPEAATIDMATGNVLYNPSYESYLDKILSHESKHPFGDRILNTPVYEYVRDQALPVANMPKNNPYFDLSKGDRFVGDSNLDELITTNATVREFINKYNKKDSHGNISKEDYEIFLKQLENNNEDMKFEKSQMDYLKFLLKDNSKENIIKNLNYITNNYNKDNGIKYAQVSALVEGDEDSNGNDTNVDNFYTDEAFINDLKNIENNSKEGFRNGRWYPHTSAEGGNPTIGYGYKLTDEDVRTKRFDKGLSDKEVNALLQTTFDTHKKNTINFLTKKYGKDVVSKLNSSELNILTDYSFNGVLNKFPKFIDSIINKNYNQALKEGLRYTGKYPLTGRNKWMNDLITTYLINPKRSYNSNILNAIPIDSMYNNTPLDSIKINTFSN